MTDRDEHRGDRGSGAGRDEELEHAGELLARLQALITAGDLDRARVLLSSSSTRRVNDASQHYGLGFVAEQLGDVQRAVLEYNYSLRDAPGQAPILLRLARLRTDQGRLDRALRAYRRLARMTPDDGEVVLELGGLLATMGRIEEAERVYSTFLEGAEDPRILEARERLGRVSAGAPEVAGKEAGRAPGGLPDLAPTDADLVTFASTFSGREGVHARQWASPAGTAGYSPVKEPFTPAVARGHLLGGYTVGIYPLRMDNTVHFLAFDLDVARFAVTRQAAGGLGMAPLLRQTQDMARSLVEAAAVHGMSGHIEDSGWKGRHVWLLFEEPVPAAAARRLAAVLMQTARPAPPEVTVEVFPRQSRVAADGLGNLIKLPLGIHRVTGNRSLFLDIDGTPLPDQFAYLRGAHRVPKEEVRQVIGRERAAVSASSAPPLGDEPSPQPPAPETGLAHEASLHAAAVFDAEYRLEDDVELLWMVDRCALLANILRRTRGNHVLSNDERIVLTYTVGHLTRGAEAVNAVLLGTLSANPQAFLKSRLRGNPMSCPKMRSRLPDLAAGVTCDCRFDPGAGLYPTPLLHLQTLRARGPLEADPARVSQLQVERHIMDLYRARTEAERASRLARDIERRLLEVMEEQGVAELSTPAGRLCLAPDGQGIALHMGAGAPPKRLPSSVERLDGDSVRDRTGSGGGGARETAGDTQGEGRS